MTKHRNNTQTAATTGRAATSAAVPHSFATGTTRASPRRSAPPTARTPSASSRCVTPARRSVADGQAPDRAVDAERGRVRQDAPGTSKLAVATHLRPHAIGKNNAMAYGPVNRAIKAGLLRAERDGRGAYALYLPRCQEHPDCLANEDLAEACAHGRAVRPTRLFEIGRHR